MALKPTAVVVLTGRNWRDYERQAGGSTGPRLGLPVTPPYRCGDAMMFELAGGTLGPGAMVELAKSPELIYLRGPIWQRYAVLGGPAGRLGRPTGKPAFSSDEERVSFEHGFIFFSEATGRVQTDKEADGAAETPSAEQAKQCVQP